MSNFGGLTFKAVAVALVLIVAHPNQLAQAQFTNGATLASCVSLTEPGFTAQPAVTNPFRITFSQSFYRPDDVIQVTFDSATVQTFTGFICQARFSNGDTTPVGSFINQNINDYRTLSCSSTDDTITNARSNQKTLPVTFTWRAPQTGPTQDVVFVTSVVLPNGQFYESSQSLPLAASATELCPNDMFADSNGDTFVQFTWTLPDRPSTIMMTNGPPSTAVFVMAGVPTVITYQFENTVTREMLTCGFILNAGANTPPTANCPGDSTVVSLPGNVGNTVPFAPPICRDAEDNVGTIAPNCSSNSGDFFELGPTTVECFCTDSEGTMARCEFIVTVLSSVINFPPQIGPCPMDITTIPVGANGFFVQFTPPSCTDPDGDAVTVTCNPADRSIVANIPSVITCECTDSSQATDSCPVTNPCSGSPCLNGGTCTAFGNTFQCSCVAGFSGTNCQTPPVNPCTNVVCQNGGTCVTNGATFICRCLFTFTGTFCEVPDTNIPPVANCPLDVTVFSVQGNFGSSANFDNAICSDSEDPAGSIIASCDRQSGSFFQGLGITAVTCTCRDSAGDSNSCVFNVNVLAFVSPNIPPVANCPADLNVVSVQGNFGGFVEFNNAVCSDSEDPAGSIIASCDRQSGSFFQGLGITVVTCTCRDSAGDSNSCVFNVNVLAFVSPNIPPVANCPADLNVVSVQGNFGSVANFDNAVCSDSEDPAGSIIASCDPQSGSFFQGLGITVVTCTCRDSAGDSNSCVFNVNVLAFVSPNIPPVANCPADVNVVSVQGNFGSVANFDNAVCSDSEDPAGSIIASCDPQSGSFFQGLGITVVTCTCRDSAGDSNSCVFNVNVLAFVSPNIQPVANCPADVNVVSVQGNFGSVANFDNAVCSDSEDPAGSIIASCDPQSGSFFQGLGITVVTCTCRDSAGDSNSCVFNVNVLAFVSPNIPPVANCPADVNVVSVQGNFGSVANFDNAVCSDSEDPAGSIIASCDPQSGSFFQGLGITVVTCTCRDSAGDSNSCVFNVNVLAFVSPNIQPVANCPADVNVVSVQGNFGSVANFDNAVCSDSEDPAGSIIASCDPQSGSFFQGLGITVVTCTCRDSAGDSNSCVFNVNVLAFVSPNIPPVANCPADVNVVSVQGNFGSVANFDNAVCSDSEDPAGSIIASCDPQSGSFFQGLGITVVTCTCRDSAGDSNSCVFNVNVLAFVSPNIPPVANCPADVNVVSVQGNFGSVANFDNAVCSDSEDPAGSIIASCDPQSGSFFQGLGITVVTCTCRDSAGDSNSCVFNVNVLAFVSPNIPPVANCPADVTELSVQGNFGGFVEFNNAVCSDSEDPAGSIIASCDRQSGSFFQGLGITVVTCTCRDSAGDSNSCVFNVNVLAFVSPNIPPVANCPADLNVVSVQGNFGSVANFDNAVCSDSEDPAGSIIASCDPQSGSFFQGLGITVVTCTCRDSAGDSNFCVFNVNVLAFVSPNIPPIIACPADLSIKADTGAPGVLVTYDNPTCSDSDGANPAVSCTPPAGIFLTLGPTTVNCICTDNDGATDSCTFSITVFANTLPVISCLGDVTEISLPGNVGNQVSYPVPACVDNEDNNALLQVVCVPPPGSFFQGVTSTRVTCTCTDTCNEADTCTFLVNIIAPNVPPSITCPADLTVKSNSAVTRSQVIFDNPLCFDSDGQNEVVTCTPSSGQFLPLGATQVTCTCTDSAGATDVCSFSISVIANTLPRISCLGDVTETSLPGNVGNQVSYPVPACVDNEDNNALLQVVCVPPPGSFFQGVTSTRVTCTCTDTCNEADTCTFLVNIIAPNIPPSITCPADLTVKSNSAVTRSQVIFDNPLCFDPDGQNEVVTCTSSSGQFLPLGATQVTCTCTDSAGATDVCSFSISVIANTLPRISCLGDVTETSLPGNVGNQASYPVPACVDNEDNNALLQVVCVPPPGSFFQGVTSTRVTCTCTDTCNEIDTCTFLVNIIALNVPPSITCPTDLSFKVDSGNPGATIPFDPPSCFDPDQPTGSLSVSCDPMRNSFLPLGPNPVFCICTDNTGASDTCSFTVTVVENSLPTISCPTPVTVTSVQTNIGNTVTYDNPVCFDAEDGIFPAVCNPLSGTFFVGVSTVTCTCTDSCDESTLCSFQVTVLDLNELPAITCPSNIIESVEAGTPGVVLPFNVPMCFDPDQASITLDISCSVMPNSFFTIGDTTVRCTCTDNAGDIDTCVFDVTVIAVDTTPPQVTCPNDVTVQVLSGNEGSIVTFTNPSAVDNFGDVFIVGDIEWYSGFYFPLGETTVEYVFSDDAGNTATCIFCVAVIASSPCDSNPCLNGGECLAESLFDFTCFCSGCFQGNLCQIPLQDPCTFNSCLNGGECEVFVGSCTQTFCECQSCTRGERCEIMVDPCAENSCANGAQCVPDPNDCSAYSCTCAGCFSGTLCTTLFDPCSLNLCQNGALCLATGDSCLTYSCTCQGCFEGFNCDRAIPNPCLNSPCQNGGFCQRQQGSCSAYTCFCLSGFSGPTCETSSIVVRNACLRFPCQNDGCCVSLLNDNYKCLCRDGYTGVDCQDLAGISNSPCDSNPCANGATCLNSYSSESNVQFFIPQYTCICPVGFSGMDCGTFTVQNAVLDQCSQSSVICRNQGTCWNTYCSFSQAIGTFCSCLEGFYGNRCEFSVTNPCLSGPCRNGGQCTSFTKYFVCQCANGFSGDTCEIGIVDVSPPTIANCPSDITVTANPGETYADVTWPDIIVFDDSGTVALVRNTGRPGIYQIGVYTIIYQYRDAAGNVVTCTFILTVLAAPVAPCDSTPCLNGGTCINAPAFGNDFRCICTLGFSGNQCETGGTGPCLPSPCLNGGSCFPSPGTVAGFFCLCNSGFSGLNCETGTVTPVDIEPPVISGCPGDITETASSNSASVTWVDPRADDNSGVTILDSRSHFPGQVFAAGTTTVSYIFMDPSGNTAVCSFDVTVIQVSTGFCSGNPNFCQNGGVCNDGVNGAVCSCAGGFAGERCAQELILVSSLPSGVFTSPNFGTPNVEGPNVGYIIQGSSTSLNLAVLSIVISPGDEVQFGSGSVVGVGTIDTFNGVSSVNNLPQARRLFQIPSSSCWVTFNTNMDGISGIGFAFQFTDE
ncbi:uncharacterized protein [Apostichopus japonicus]|uniref:uncharacterized protein isoform X2 n=1 Tax=Stichopus japonicus TaxID=307972 RepID=UPI003AB1DE3F